MLVDTHCHIHEADYPLDRSEVLTRAGEVGVEKLICVGTDEASSKLALDFATKHREAYATVGVHPHDTKSSLMIGSRWSGVDSLELMARDYLSRRATDGVASKLVAVGEIGLDYYYEYSSRDIQIAAFEAQIDLALRLGLPISFHVRNAFEDFWPIFDNFQGIKGVLHSFTDSQVNLDQALMRGLYIGVNGISTFTKDAAQVATFSAVPLDKLLLETDAPFLTPTPYRGKVNEPAFVEKVAVHHAQARGLAVDEIAAATTSNASALFEVDSY